MCTSEISSHVYVVIPDLIRDPPLRWARLCGNHLTPNKPHKTQAHQLAAKPSIAQIGTD